MKPIAQDHVVVHRSEHPRELFLGSPSIVALADGRLVASLDWFGPGVSKHCTGPVGKRYHFDMQVQAGIFTSEDGGKTWTQRATFAFQHARLFEAGGALYLLGHKGNIMIMKSADAGITWSTPVALTDPDDKGGRYTQAPANVLTADGKIHLIMMYLTDYSYRGYFVSTLALVGMRALANMDLCDRRNWSISPPSEAFRELVPDNQLDYFGVPFFDVPDRNRDSRVVAGRPANRIGWHEAHLLQIVDPNHQWFDPSGSTFHVLARADAHRSNMAALAVMKVDDDGCMRFELQEVPSGKAISFLPLPGGNIKFHVLYDQPTRLYWLVSNQVTDSMTRPDALPPERYGLPCNQRERLVLHFSKNLVDWQFAGLVAKGKSPLESRSYASMDVDGQDLVILSRSADEYAKSAHDTNLITFHRVEAFRGLNFL